MSRIETFVLGDPGDRLFCFCELPPEGEKFPFVVMLHGFTGEHIASSFKFPRLSRRLVNRGIATVRFDFRGSGDSEGEFCDMTPLTELSDAIEVLSFIKRSNWFSGRLGIVGYSMGGLIASLLAGRSEGIGALLLWSPLLDSGEFFRREALNFSEGEEFKDVLGLRLGKRFQRDGLNVDPLMELKKHSGHSLIVHGSDDEAVPFEPVKAYAADLSIDLHVVEGGNHKYQRLDWMDDLLSVSEQFLCNALL